MTIHLSIVYTSCSLGSWESWSKNKADFGHEVGYTPGRSPVYCRANTDRPVTCQLLMSKPSSDVLHDQGLFTIQQKWLYRLWSPSATWKVNYSSFKITACRKTWQIILTIKIMGLQSGKYHVCFAERSK